MKKRGFRLLQLHGILFLYSLSGVCGKMAARQKFLSPPFFLLYGCVLLLLTGYALCWQQIIKSLPLTTAYAHKAVTTVWGLIWGTLLFHELLTPGKIFGTLLVIGGMILFSSAGKESS